MGTALYAGYNRSWKPTMKLGGKHAGRWKTEQAKAYPAKLCQIIAQQHISHAAMLKGEGHTDDPPDLQEALAALTFSYDPYMGTGKGTTMRADYNMCPMRTANSSF